MKLKQSIPNQDKDFGDQHSSVPVISQGDFNAKKKFTIQKRVFEYCFICILTMLLILLMPHIVLADLEIKSVMYDPAGADSNKEWIEIYNPTDQDISLENYTLEFGNGASENDWKTIWTASEPVILPPSSYYLIGGSEVLPTPDVVITLSLQNGPDAIKLTKNNETADLVGYGELAFEEYFLGGPAVDAKDSPLVRHSSTNNNKKDFSSDPLYLPHTFFTTDQLEIVINTTIQEIGIRGVILQDQDPTKSGIQVMPIPEQSKIIPVSIIAETNTRCDDLELELSFKGKSYSPELLSDNDTVCTFLEEIRLESTDDAGEYELIVSLNSKENSDLFATKTIEFEYARLLAFKFKKAKFSFNTNDPKTKFKGDTMIQNLGNTPINLELSTPSANFTLVSGNAVLEKNMLNLHLMPGSSKNLNFTVMGHSKRLLFKAVEANVVVP